MNGIQCKEELDLEKNINNLPKMVKKVKAKYQKVKGYVCVYTAILVEEKHGSSLYFLK